MWAVVEITDGTATGGWHKQFNWFHTFKALIHNLSIIEISQWQDNFRYL